MCTYIQPPYMNCLGLVNHTADRKRISMHLKLILLVVSITTVLCAPKSGTPKDEAVCDDTCQLPNCRCLSTDVPGGLEPSEIPQLVLLTFDDAVTNANFQYYKQSFFNRTNPDGCPVGTTYFVSHEYTDYSKVHTLHAYGQEIALHSITHSASTSYWNDLSLEGFVEEFGEQLDLVQYFADIPREDIQGIRVPLLQLSGDKSFETIQKVGMTYDSSWPTQNFMDPPLWPYTLDFVSTQDCPIGACPSSTFPGVWVQPMVDWYDDQGYVCSMVDACPFIPTEVDDIVEFMKGNFKRHYESNRAPFGFYVHAAWFQANAVHYDAYNKFLDYLQSLDDVYIVGINRALDWVRNPTRTRDIKSLWSECQPTYEPTCVSKTCQVMKGDEYRYFTQCKSCPSVYPWLGNPLGE